MLTKENIKNATIAVTSLVATPLLLFISTSIPIYLKNQDDLGRQFSVFLPFLCLFAGTLLVGVLLWLCSGSRLGRVLLWAYYLAGPLFLVFSLIGDIAPPTAQHPLGLYALSIVFIGLALVAAYLLRPQRAAIFFALLGLLLLVTDAYRVLSGVYWYAQSDQNSSAPIASASPSAGKRLPNIYHIIFDAYQSDIFSTILTEKLRKELAGFRYLPKATAIYSYTTWSVPSVFVGGKYDFSRPQFPKSAPQDADCETSKEATATTQSQCAPQLLVDFVDELKALKKFQESLIIVHGDHGDKFVMQAWE